MSVPADDSRSEMYGDLFRFLVPGFLTSRISIDGHTYCLRSLTASDLYLLSGVVKDTSPEWRLWVVAASLWMVDGVPLLEDSSYAPRAAYKALCRSNRRVVGALFGTVIGFFQRARKTGSYLESFLYEQESRQLWHSTKNPYTRPG